MTLKQIIKNYTWLNIKQKLLELYPDEEENGNLLLYEEVLEKLRFMSPVSSDIMLNITWQQDDFDDEKYVDVSGKDLNPDTTLPIVTDACAIEFTPWNKWLGMEITDNTLKDFSELEILCHSLYEMTFIDFEEESIQDEIKRIHDIKDEYDNMSEEERKKNTKSLDDFLKELGDEDNSETD
jgi:hypothetical protein